MHFLCYVCRISTWWGTPIGPLDMMIAGHAKSLGYTIVTNNIKEFKRVKDLKLENWTE